MSGSISGREPHARAGTIGPPSHRLSSTDLQDPWRGDLVRSLASKNTGRLHSWQDGASPSPNGFKERKDLAGREIYRQTGFRLVLKKQIFGNGNPMALRKHTSKEIGQAIKKIRLGLHLSQQELGRQLGYSQDTIAKWEGGQIPHVFALQQIARMCNRSVDWILAANKSTRERNSDGTEVGRAGTHVPEQSPTRGRHLKSRTGVRNGHGVAGPREKRSRSTQRIFTKKSTTPNLILFKMLGKQLRSVIRDEAEAALENGVSTILQRYLRNHKAKRDHDS